jgi:hypothetical protein
LRTSATWFAVTLLARVPKLARYDAGLGGQTQRLP